MINIKQTTKLAAIFLLAILATACDPAFTEDAVILNTSSHPVTIITGPRDRATGETGETKNNRSYSIKPGEEVLIQTIGYLGGADYWDGVNMFLEFYGDSVTFRFNEETEPQIVYHRDDFSSNSPYNFNSSNYQYEEERKTGLVFHNHPHYGKLTFSITDEHFNEACH